MAPITVKAEARTDIHDVPNNPTMKGFQCHTAQTRRLERKRVALKPVIKNTRKIISKELQATDGAVKNIVDTRAQPRTMSLEKK
jgi:hypothetical protein